MKKAVYLRVSKKELNEKTQLPVILKNFQLKESEVIVLQERISGYKQELQEKRTELNKLLELIEKRQIKELYVYSLERIYRNIDWLMRFYFICRTNGVEVFSYLQPEINTFTGGKPIDTFLKYQSVLVNGFMGEQESYLISERTKKAFSIDEDGNRVSYKGNKAGRKTDITQEDKDLIKELSSNGKSYNDIIKIFKKDYGKKLSKGYISSIINDK